MPRKISNADLSNDIPFSSSPFSGSGNDKDDKIFTQLDFGCPSSAVVIVVVAAALGREGTREDCEAEAEAIKLDMAVTESSPERLE